ncbi:MAG: caspase family protein [Deltaproteobacteria bacterium]|nr:caspase family protein [Deltaproteobacteria bacterium]
MNLWNKKDNQALHKDPQTARACELNVRQIKFIKVIIMEFNQMQKLFLIWILLFGFAVTSQGCASRVTTSSEKRHWKCNYIEDVKINTVPPGATVYLQEKKLGSAPVTEKVKVSEFTLVQEGTYKIKTLMTIDKNFSGWTPAFGPGTKSERVNQTTWDGRLTPTRMNTQPYTIIAYAEGFKPTKKEIVIDASDSAFNRAIADAAPNGDGRMNTTFLGERNVLIVLRPDSDFDNKIISRKQIEPKLRTVDGIPNNKSNNWAVIIGISQYQYPEQNGLNNLVFADDDAKAFARSLHNLGWTDSHIKLLTNRDATERNIKIALKSWLTKAGPDDQVILFWAGHGYADPEDPEKVYLATYDTELSIPATGYRMDEVRRALEEIGSKNVILLADTCHAGKLITRGDGNRGISIVPNIKKQNVPKGWVFMVGADTDRQAIEHTSWRNGAFTHCLIKGLNGEADGFQSAGAKDGIVTMGELKDYMKTAMPDETQKVLGVAKHPVIATSTGDPNIWNLTLQVTP